MGRKIPGKKHRGVKDPWKQQAKRRAELQGRTNAPPRDVEEQPVPRSFERVVQLAEAAKAGKIGRARRKRRKGSSLIRVGATSPGTSHPKARPEKIVPVFQQRPGESGQRFLHRVDTETYAFLKETAFEKKYGVQVDRNPETGEIEGLSKRERTELDVIENLKSTHKNIKRRNKSETDTMTKGERRKEKLRVKKESKKMETLDEFEDLRDQVRFGEVVHEPPQLKTRPKKADSSTTSKPGKKTLLLHTLLANGHGKSEKPVKSRSGKRKNLPAGERRQLEKQQSDVVAAYRRLKAQRSSAGK